jgi:hypothetical protein
MILLFELFDFVFSEYLMVAILRYNNDLLLCLQRREQDIINALSLVSAAKNKMEQLRPDGCVVFLQMVTLFCHPSSIYGW